MWWGAPIVVSLEALHARSGHLAAEEWIFAGALDHASPAGVAGDVHHRREGPVDADSRCFIGGSGLNLAIQVKIPGCGLRDRHRKDGAEAVDHVEADEQRNVQSRLVDGYVLHAVDLMRVGEEEVGTKLALFNAVVRRAFVPEDL